MAAWKSLVKPIAEFSTSTRIHSQNGKGKVTAPPQFLTVQSGAKLLAADYNRTVLFRIHSARATFGTVPPHPGRPRVNHQRTGVLGQHQSAGAPQQQPRAVAHTNPVCETRDFPFQRVRKEALP
jgi:hypothetical protein